MDFDELAHQAVHDAFDVLKDGVGELYRTNDNETVPAVRLFVDRDLEVVASDGGYGEVRHRATVVTLLLADLGYRPPVQGDLVSLNGAQWKVQQELVNDGIEVQVEATPQSP